MIAEPTPTAPDLGQWLDKVTCIDCHDGLARLDSNSVELTLTDPPYGISAPNKVRSRPKSISACGVAFASGDFGAEDRDAGTAWLSDVARVLRPGGSLVCFAAMDQWGLLRAAGEAVGLTLRNAWYWCKNNPPPTPRENFASAVETGAWFVKPGAPPTWTGGHTTPNWFEGPHYSGTFACGGRVHPMQKPAWLMERLIELWSRPGDLVLDPFAGSGETLIQAMLAGRQCIGFEIDPQHCAAANARIAAARRAMQPALALETEAAP